MRPILAALFVLLIPACAAPSQTPAPWSEAPIHPEAITLAAPIRQEGGLPEAPAGGPEAETPAICQETWVAEREKKAERDGLRFTILPGASFDEGNRSYTFGVQTPADPDAGFLTLLGFVGARGASPHQFFAEKIETLAMSMIEEDRRKPSGCVAPDMGHWFRVTVVDLDGDRRKEVVVQSNAVGSCGACLADVRVYKFDGESLDEVLDEPYNGITFAAGKGLVVEAYGSGEAGPVAPTRKTFFMTSKRP